MPPPENVFADRMCANSLVGGIVADIFEADTRGVPMSVFAFLILSGQGLGAVVCGKYRCERLLESTLMTVKQDGWI